MHAIKEVKKQGTPSLERIKTVLRDKGKNMKIGHFYFCDGCEQPTTTDPIFVTEGHMTPDPRCDQTFFCVYTLLKMASLFMGISTLPTQQHVGV